MEKKSTFLILMFSMAFFSGCNQQNRDISQIDVLSNHFIIESTDITGEKSSTLNESSMYYEKDCIGEDLFDYSALNVHPYQYSEEFEMGENLKTVLEVVLSNGMWGEEYRGEKWYQEDFIKTFVENINATCSYASQEAAKNDEKLSKEQIVYMHFSLTGEYIPFDQLSDEDYVEYSVERTGYEGSILSYEAKETDEGIQITGIFEEGLFASSYCEEHQFEAIVMKNPYSCYDGYSIKNIHIVEENDSKEDSLIPKDGETYYVDATLIGKEDVSTTETPIFEFSDCSEEIDCNYTLYIDLSKCEDYIELINNHKEETIRFTFIYDSSMGNSISYFSPISAEIMME